MDRDLGSTWWQPPPNPELYGHVVVGVDGSAHSGKALVAAVTEADRRDVRLEIVHRQTAAARPPLLDHGTPRTPPRRAPSRTGLSRARQPLKAARHLR
ncbi:MULTISPECIES: universal stress protein [unclassified Streptomyces]|uniref:universal stress protein n=1 Tax=unclassified Streptomyces TaxID=2593676 RepID=UPI002D21CCE6|nr:universal stress protein [Streptomyces sp. BoleA5]